jgi:hypothetical protein
LISKVLSYSFPQTSQTAIPAVLPQGPARKRQPRC